MPSHTRSPVTRTRPGLSRLEDRAVPALLTGLSGGVQATYALVTFDSATPGNLITNKAVTGLNRGDTLVGIDYRPANGKLYGLGSQSQLYTLDPATGAATPVGTPFIPALSGTNFGFNFNPAVDKIRVVSDTGQNFRLNADTGAVVGTDTALAYDPASYAAFFGGTAPAPTVTAAAYTKNSNPTTGATTTTLYDIDTKLDVLTTQGGPGDDPTSPSPNTGTLFIVDQLGFDAPAATGFDIEAATDTAYLTAGTKLYTVNLATGAATAAGTLGGGVSVTAVSVNPPATGAGTIQLAAATATFPTTRQPIGVTVTRTGGATGAATIDFATADGTAVAGVDYLPTSGTLSFAAGQTSQTVFLSLPATASAGSPDRTFTLTLSNPTGGATLGPTKTATVTIPGVANPPPTGRFFVAGAGAGTSPSVVVFDAVTGSKAYVLNPFEPSFQGGTSVATGDLNGDGVDDIAVGTGLGGAPRVVVYDGATKAVIADFFAYESSFRGGVQVATGDVNGDGFADLIIGSGVGGGPRVRVLNGLGVATAAGSLGDPTTQGAVTLADFFAYESSFRGGVQVASGEFNGDGNDDVVAGSGVGGGPRVRILNGLGLLTVTGAAAGDPAQQGALTLADYFAYESTFRNGVNVAAGDVNGDGRVDVVTGPGDGGAPLVRAFSGRTSTGIGSGFFAYDQALRGGVRVATADLGANGTAEILTGAGKGGPSAVRVFTATGGSAAADLTPFASDFTGGVFVG